MPSLVAESEGWWYPKEVLVYPEEGASVTSKFEVQSVTYYGHSANCKTPNFDNWECIIRGYSQTHSTNPTAYHAQHIIAQRIIQCMPSNVCHSPHAIHLMSSTTCHPPHVIHFMLSTSCCPPQRFPTKRRTHPRAKDAAEHTAELSCRVKMP